MKKSFFILFSKKKFLRKFEFALIDEKIEKVKKKIHCRNINNNKQ